MTETRVAIVTGAARGLGFGYAKALAQTGAHVVMADILPQVADAAAELRGEGLSVTPFEGDISDEASVQHLVDDVGRDRGRIDILVNNAGISPKKPDGSKSLVEETTLEEWDRVLRVNLTSAFLLSRAVVPIMRRQNWGRIISMSSQAGRTRALLAGGAYSASKAALIGFSRLLASEVATAGITVNCIAPGRVATPLAAVAGGAANAKFAAEIPMGRMGSVEELAATVVFLASEGAGYITGVTIDVNGGHFMT